MNGVDAPQEPNPETRPAPAHRAGTDPQEVGALLRLVASLGVTVALAIVSFFFGSLWLDRRLQFGGVLVAPGVLIGVLLSFIWTYLSIARHVKRYGPDSPDKGETRG